MRAGVQPGGCRLHVPLDAPRKAAPGTPGVTARDASIGAAMATGCCLGWLVFGALPGGREGAACLWRTPLVADSGGNNPL